MARSALICRWPVPACRFDLGQAGSGGDEALGIRVNAVAPGYLDTDQTAPLRADADRKRQIDARIPVGRWGSADDIASAVAFLVAGNSAYVNGHTLVVDGGWLGR